jgi:hypothetical protein
MRQVFLLALALGAACPQYAQRLGASLSGYVFDGQQLAVRGAAVLIRNVQTGAEQRLVTDEGGRWMAPSLAPGEYEVSIEAAGFARFDFEPLGLTIGESRQLRAALQPAGGAQTVTVSAGEVSPVDTSTGQASQTFEARLMNDLPMFAGSVGRNFRTQVYLAPGVAPSTVAHRPFAVSGARNRNNNYLIDSNDYNEIEGGLLMGRGASEQLISTEAIDAMQVITHNFKAEYGRQNGSVVSIITKRGTNTWHGLAYHYLRHSDLGTRNTFDLARPALKFNQLGGNLGGPLKKDRVFLFGNYELFLRRQAVATTIQSLRPEQRALAAPSVAPLVRLYPEPNLPGTNLFRSNLPAPADQHSFVLRGDVDLSASQRMFSRTTFLTSENNGFANGALTRYSGSVGSQGHSLHHIWTPRATVVNEARFNYTRFRIADRFPDPVQLGDPSVNGPVGFVIVNGLTSLGHLPFWGRATAQNNFQYTDDLTLVRRRHTFKMGAAVRRLQLNSGAVTTGFTGQMRFNNVNDFLAGRPAAYNRNVGNPLIGQRAIEFNTYFQDDWQASSRLTLNLGVRYELNTVPVEVNNLIDNRYRFRPDRNNVAPRFGFAYLLGGKSATVLRGAYGIHYNVLELAFHGLARFNPPLIRNLVAANPQLPNVLATAQQSIPSGLVIPDPGVRLPYAQHYQMALEGPLFSQRVTASVGYVGTTGVKLPRASRPNGGDALAQALRPDPAVGVVNYLETAATSRYDAMQATLNVSRRDLIVRTSYTWGKFIDTISDFPTTNQNIDRGLLALDESNRRLDRAPSDFDLRHMLSVAWSWDLPAFRRNRWLGGWALQGIATMQSGRPYTLFSGTDNLIGTNNNRILNIPGTLVRQSAANRVATLLAPGVSRAQLTPGRGELGTLGRNTERADALSQLNVSLFKTFRITESLNIQLRAETFNLLNQVNYGLPDGLLTSPNFGQAVTAGDSRSTQLALRISF